MKIANYKNIKCDYEQILEYKGEDNWPETSTDFVRITELLEIEFVEIPNIQGELIQEELKIVDQTIAELFNKIEYLRAKKAELLSLTYEVKEDEIA